MTRKTMTTPTIRPAIANDPDDARAFADFADMAGWGIFTQMLGGKAPTILAKMFAHPANDNSHEYAHFLLVDGRIAGMFSAFTGAQKEANHRRTEWLYLRYATWRSLGLLYFSLLFSRVLSFMDWAEPDACYVEMIALYPPYRGRGLSKLLLAEAERIAGQAGCASLALDVHIHNRVAIAAYKSSGFHIAASSPVVRRGGQEIGVHRMVKAVNVPN